MIVPTKQNKQESNMLSPRSVFFFFLIKNSIAPYLESLLKAKKIEKKLDILTYNRNCNRFVAASQQVLLKFN